MSKRRVRHHVNPLADQTEVVFDGFGNDKPVIVDIGADHGEFSAGLLEKFGKEKNIIAFEIRKPRAKKLQEMFAPHKNVAVFAGDAVRNMKNVLEPCIAQGAVIEEIYINFPDPWFKARHHKRRVMSKRLIDAVQTWLPAGTKWIYQTDQKHLFDDTRTLLEENGITNIRYFDEAPYGLTTKWENAKVLAGEKIYRMAFFLPPTNTF